MPLRPPAAAGAGALRQDRTVAAEIYLNVAVSGLLTGLVYGLMALGLSVIFGVVRVVNFAHGEMMTIAMYLAIVAVQRARPRPAGDAGSDRRVLFALGYALQAGIINPFINRPEHSQFMLLVAIAIIIVNVLLIVFGPDARNVQTSLCLRQLRARAADRRRHQGLCRRRDDRGRGGAVRLLPLRARSARRSAPAPTTTPARWWSGSTSSGSMR